MEDFFLLDQIRKVQTLWLAEIQNPDPPEKKALRDQMCLRLAEPVDRYYLETYAPKKKGKMRHGERTAE